MERHVDPPGIHSVRLNRARSHPTGTSTDARHRRLLRLFGDDTLDRHVRSDGVPNQPGPLWEVGILRRSDPGEFMH